MVVFKIFVFVNFSLSLVHPPPKRMKECVFHIQRSILLTTLFTSPSMCPQAPKSEWIDHEEDRARTKWGNECGGRERQNLKSLYSLLPFFKSFTSKHFNSFLPNIWLLKSEAYSKVESILKWTLVWPPSRVYHFAVLTCIFIYLSICPSIHPLTHWLFPTNLYSII